MRNVSILLCVVMLITNMLKIAHAIIAWNGQMGIAEIIL